VRMNNTNKLFAEIDLNVTKRKFFRLAISIVEEILLKNAF
jgi:hypothetical protein